jgi:hypothetical protein
MTKSGYRTHRIYKLKNYDVFLMPTIYIISSKNYFPITVKDVSETYVT